MFSAEFETSQWLNCSKTVLLSLLHFRMLISRPINFYDGRLNVNRNHTATDTNELLDIHGHVLLLHAWDSELLPEQLRPPLFGVGLVQVRLRVCVPPPHVCVQLPQAPQFDQPPLTI